MAYGVWRASIGALSLVASAATFIEINMNESRTPNEIADRRITEQDRQEKADIQQALTQESGPIFNKAKLDCETQKTQSQLSNIQNAFTVHMLKSLGANTDFNMDLCVRNSISKMTMFDLGKTLPGIGKADQVYKDSLQQGLRNSGCLLAAFGLALMLPLVRNASRKDNDCSGPKVRILNQHTNSPHS